MTDILRRLRRALRLPARVLAYLLVPLAAMLPPGRAWHRSRN